MKRRRECSESPCQFSPASSSGYSSNGGDPHNSRKLLFLFDKGGDTKENGVGGVGGGLTHPSFPFLHL